MTQLVTRCPQCSTSFRITPAQIQKARGAVRCGSCLHIFNAEQHLLDGTSANATERRSKPIKRAPAAAAPTQTQLPIDDQPHPKAAEPAKTPPAATGATARAASPDKPPAERRHKDRPKQRPTAAQKPKNAALLAPKTAPQAAAKTADSAPSTQTNTGPASTQQDGLLRFDQGQIDRESMLGDDILISDDMDSPATGADKDLYLAPRDTSHSLFERRIEHEPEAFVDTSDESWAESLLESEPPQPPPGPSGFDTPLSITRQHEHEPEPTEAHEEHTQAPQPLPERDKAKATSNKPKPAPEPHFYLYADRAEESPELPPPAQGYQPLRAYDNERSALLMGIAREPVELSSAYHNPWRKRLLWGGLCVSAVLLLAVQLAWLQFDRYGRIEPYRSYYQSACSLIGCQLPTVRDSSKIHTSNLVVRRQTGPDEALIVDAIILNSANFKQPYPALLLSFSDIGGNPVASRLFTPKEYLRGELTGHTIMPSNQPVHLSLALMDPGPEAVNYNLIIP